MGRKLNRQTNDKMAIMIMDTLGRRGPLSSAKLTKLVQRRIKIYPSPVTKSRVARICSNLRKEGALDYERTSKVNEVYAYQWKLRGEWHVRLADDT